ncbi:MAG TPA: hypothetical protein PKY50_00715 [Candidatus Competibacter sp.]|nr:hypothetical protein [Candidatus Competibacter sp.]
MPRPNAPALLAALLLAFSTTAGYAAAWPDHVAQAQTYVGQLKANNNNYGSPALIDYDATGALRATTKCSSFVSLLLKNTYSGVITDQVLVALTGSSSPYADEWFAAIQSGATDAKSGLKFLRRSTVASMQTGDLIASSYTISGNTGHAMILANMSLTDAQIAPPYPIPGVTLVNRYRAKVYDSTQTIHGNYASNIDPDSRYNKQWNGTAWVADQGLGSGYIALYEDVATGAPVAWAWNTSKTTKSFYYAVTPPAGSTMEYRPLAIGYLQNL